MQISINISRKTLLIILAAIVVIGGIGGAFLLWKYQPWQRFFGPELIDYQSEKHSFSLKYPDGFVVGEIAPVDQESDALMLKLVRLDPPTLVLFWKEGLGMAGAFIKKPLLQYLRDNVARRYETEYNDFKKEQIEDTTLGGEEAFSAWFTFQETEKTYKEKIKLTVAVKGSTGYYLQCMAPVEEWEDTETSCDIIAGSFEFGE